MTKWKDKDYIAGVAGVLRGTTFLVAGTQLSLREIPIPEKISLEISLDKEIKDRHFSKSSTEPQNQNRIRDLISQKEELVSTQDYKQDLRFYTLEEKERKKDYQYCFLAGSVLTLLGLATMKRHGNKFPKFDY